jgi:hypothetical protein
VEVTKRLALRIGYRTIPVYDDAIRAGKVVRRLDLVKRAAETPEFHAERPCDRYRRVRRSASLVALALGGTFSTAVLAEGPGKYTVSGTNVKDKSEYHGTAILTQTGRMTWEVVGDIAGNTVEGFGIGDGKAIVVTFSTDGAVALYTANADGSYTGMWAEEGDKDVSTETLKPQ